jgi:glycosyltransferase involved in cell wall biosynthesis
VERGAGSGDGNAPDLTLPDEETLRLRERLRHEGWPAGPASARFAGHALVIDDDLPRPDRDAGSIATFEQMLLLRRLGWHVTFCPVHAITLDPADADALARQGIEVAGPPAYGSVTQYLQAEGANLELVHVYRYSNAAMLLDRVRELAPDAKLIFATADLHFLREQRRAELTGQPFAEAAREEELRCMRAADATIITSDHEMQVLRDAIAAEKLVLLRWITRPQPVAQGFAGRRDICFVGNFRHPPNLDGVQWFLAEVLPLVRAALPDLRLKLAGSGMPQAIQELAGEGVEVLGWVEDLASLFGSVRLSVAPLRFGAGFKGKVATSLAYGLPVVGSSISLEGTGLENGDGVAVADTPAEFAAAIVRLHEDAAQWQALSQRGLERVAALYSPDAALAIWRRLLEGLGLAVSA